MIRILAAFIVITAVSAADATITADHFLWDWGTLPESGDEFFTYRFQVHVTTTPGHTDDDDWTAGDLYALLADGQFHEHTFGGDPPNPALFRAFPDLEFDSYYTGPDDYPNTDYDGASVGVAYGWCVPWELEAAWFDTVDSGNGDFVIAQVTILPREPDWELTGILEYTAADTLVQPYVYAFTIPESSALTLLALGGLATLRRRR